MTVLNDGDPNGESLLRDFESQIQGGAVFGAELPIDLRAFLEERKLLLTSSDPRFHRLLEAQLANDIRAGRTNPDGILVNSLLQQFGDVPCDAVCDLAILEFRLRMEARQSLSSADFASGVRGLDDSHRQQLADDLKQLSYLLPTAQQTSDGLDLSYQFESGDRVGSYRIIRAIGRGGMGEVYMAQQLQPIRRIVALKVLQRRGLTSSEYRLRFEAERQAQALMDHPHIAKVFEAGVTDRGLAFVAMEYVSGISIVKYCDDHSLTINDRLSLFLQTCRAIQHAHQKGIIHRDITPGNVLVSDSTSGPTVRVIDFGLAKALQSEIQLTEEEMYSVADLPIGTFFFMSPEQTSNARGTDIRTDVYSLGAVFYMLLTGTPPIADPSFREKPSPEKCRIICHEEPPRPSQRVGTLNAETTAVAERRQLSQRNLSKVLAGELDWIVLKALEKDPERRYATVAEFAEDIERFLTQRPVLARPQSLSYRFRKAIRRNKAATVVIATVLMAAVGMTYLQIGRWSAEAAQKVAEREALLRRALVTPAGTTPEDNELLVLDEAMASDLITDIDRADLHLAKLSVLHRLQSVDRLYQLLEEIHPMTDRQRGQVALWKVRKAYPPEEQQKLAADLFERKTQYELDAPDVGYLQSLLALTQSDAIRILYEVIEKSPQHEFSRKMLITLLLVQGRSKELDEQIEKARLLFPGSVDVELADGVARAFRGDTDGVELHLKRLQSMPLLTQHDRDLQEKLLKLILNLSDTVLKLHHDSLPGSARDLMTAVTDLWKSLAKRSEISRFGQDLFGVSRRMGIQDPSAPPVKGFFSDGIAGLLSRENPLTLSGAGVTRLAISKMESLSPFPNDAFFARLRAYTHLSYDDYQGASRELDVALESPCVFPRMKSRMLCEAAICHIQLFLDEKEPKDPAKLRRAGELALRWVEDADGFEPVAAQSIQNILNFTSQYDVALIVIHRCREANPALPPTQLVPDELKTLRNAKRFPEVIQVAERWLANDSGASAELKLICRTMRDEAMSLMRQIVNDAADSEAPLQPIK